MYVEKTLPFSILLCETYVSEEKWTELADLCETTWNSIPKEQTHDLAPLLKYMKIAYSNLGKGIESYFEKLFTLQYSEEGSVSITKEWWVAMKKIDFYKEKNEVDSFIQCCEQAWSLRKTSEPMIELSGHYLKVNNHAKAYECAKRAKDAGVAHPEIDRVMMIVAYYVGKMEDGLEACDALMLDRTHSQTYKTQGLTNLFWYAQPLPILQKVDIGKLTHIPTIPGYPEQAYNPLNPAILPYNDGYYVNCRLVNYYQDTVTGVYTIYDKNNVIQTRNMLLTLDADFNVKSQREIVDRNVRLQRYPAFAKGLEDMRLVWCDDGEKDTILFSATSLEGSPQSSPTIAMGILDHQQEEVCPVEQYVCMKKPIPGRQEKNWIPFVLCDEHGVDIVSIYCFDPFTVLRCDIHTGDIDLLAKTPQKVDLSNLRGSSGVIPYGAGYLTVTHQITVFNNRRYYFHRFLYFVIEDGEYTVKQLTHPFYFVEKDVEFCSGLCTTENGTSFLLTVGVKDREAYLFEVDVNVVETALFDI
uniref:Uncharacterized protein n=1 Tax=Pithovirus LCPAC304 TaxID=2506594 RepID=A0A481Z9G3_9VIRU|nr:MAG: protein of unknown function DUF3589 [Pithovirus LCPAC304]